MHQPVENRHTRWLATVLLPILWFAGTAALQAQTRDACLSASGRNATTVCYRALENGDRDASVYQKLITEHFKRGEVARAQQMLGTAMSIHGETESLVALQVLVYGDTPAPDTTTERDVAEAAIKQFGLLKSLCLTNNGPDGLAACRRYLEVSDDPDGVVALRLEALNSLQVPVDGSSSAPNSVATTNGPDDDGPVSTDRSNDNSGRSRDTDTATTNPNNTNDRVRSSSNNPSTALAKSVVRDIQTELNALGFEAGTPDGLIGKQSRSALAQFYAKTGLPERTEFNTETLSDLHVEKARLQVARELYALSLQASEKGDATLAMEYLEQADRRSQLLGVPADYEDKLDDLLGKLDQLILQVRQLQFAAEQRQTRFLSHRQEVREISEAALSQP